MIENYLSGEAGIGIISGMLFAVGTMLLMIEALSPGLGFEGFGGVACHLACFAPDVLSGNASWGVMILAACGCVLLLLESRFVGIGVLGWLGVALLLGALWMATINVMQFVYTLCASAVMSGIAVPIAISHLPNSKIMTKIALCDTLEGSGMQQKQLPDVGVEGVVFSDLKPHGIVCIQGERYAANAKEFIQKDMPVRVVEHDSNVLYVERI